MHDRILYIEKRFVDPITLGNNGNIVTPRDLSNKMEQWVVGQLGYLAIGQQLVAQFATISAPSSQ